MVKTFEPIRELTAGGRRFNVTMLTPTQLEKLRPMVREMSDAMCDLAGLMLTARVFCEVVGADHPDLAPEDIAFVITRAEAGRLARALAYQYTLAHWPLPSGHA